MTVFDDSLASGWSDASWGGTANYTVGDPVQSGTTSLSFINTAAWGALAVVRNAFNTAGYTALTFAARASALGQRYSVMLYANGQTVGRAILLATYGGDPLPGAWTTYVLPLDSTGLNAAGQGVTGIVIQDYTGQPQPAVYLDNLGFAGPSPTPTPAPTPTPTPTPAPTPTPTPTSTPTPTPTPTG